MNNPRYYTPWLHLPIELMPRRYVFFYDYESPLISHVPNSSIFLSRQRLQAKASELKFNETTLTCAWHKGSRNEVSKEDNADDEEEAIDSFNATYDDVYGEEVPFEDGGSDYAEDEEQLVDYD
jgi:hypothetical protein